MLPDTSSTPKALLEVAGRPFAARQLAWLAQEGVTDVVYCIAHLGDQIRAAVDNGSRWGLRVRYSDEGERRLGTGGALRLAAHDGLLDDRFLVIYGDSYLQVSVRDVWTTFEASGLPALMTVYRNDVASERCNTRFVDGRVDAYEKGLPDPAGVGMHHVDYGLLAFDRAIVERSIPADTVADLSDLQHTLAAQGLLAGYEATHRFYEIGSPRGRSELEGLLSSG
jgi:NDP-sugar pyrophosphorylase family protein